MRGIQERRQKALATESIGRLLFRLSLPAGVGMFVMSLYNVVDTIFIGHVIGPLGIAGLSIVFPVQILVMGIGQLIGMGSASLISRALGAGDHERAGRSFGNAVVLLVVLSSVLVGAAGITPLSTLECTIRVDFVGHLGTVDDEGRLLAYDGEIHGDIEGQIVWWLDSKYSHNIGQVSYYAARWEIYDLAGNLLLAGDDAGTTAMTPGEDGICRGKGIVTEASA